MFAVSSLRAHIMHWKRLGNMVSLEVAGWRPRGLSAVIRYPRVDTIPYLSYRMKQPKVLFLAVMASLPLVLVSCIGGGQPTGGWAGPTVHDGIVYVGTRDGRVVAINASSREQQWQWPDTAGLRGLIYATPILHDDLVYVGTYNGQVYALTSDRGAERWVYPRTGSIGAIIGRPVVVNETMYVTSSDGRVYALDVTYGDLKWESESLAGKLWTSPAVMGDTLYVSTLDGYIYDLSLETGQLLGWSFKADAGFASSPVVYEDHIYVGSFDRYLYAIRIGSNASMWRFPEEELAGNWFWASPIVKEGIVYAGCLDGKLYAIEAETGEELWEFDAASPIVSSPVLTDNLLIIIDESGTVYVFDVSTEFGDEAAPLRTISIGASVRSSFYAQDGLVYIRSEDNSIYVVDIDRGEIVEGWPVSLTAEE
jgi:outer membrane protein assembly factor BamB